MADPIDKAHSSRWAIAHTGSYHVSAGGRVNFELVNLLTNRAHELRWQGGGGGISLPSVGSVDCTKHGYVEFRTGRLATFDTFDGARAVLTIKGVGVPYVKSYSKIDLEMTLDYANPPMQESVEVDMRGGGDEVGYSKGLGWLSVIYGTGLWHCDAQPLQLDQIDQNADEEITGKAWSISEDDRYLELPSDILFPFDHPKPSEAWLFDPKATAVLKDVAAFIRQKAKEHIMVEGYTDSIGPDDYNLALSERRARAVANWLTTTGDVKLPTDVWGRGKAFPVVPNSNIAPTKANIDAQARNRRIKILYYVRR